MGNTLPKYVSQTHVQTGWACSPDRVTQLSLVTPATCFTCRLQVLLVLAELQGVGKGVNSSCKKQLRVFCYTPFEGFAIILSAMYCLVTNRQFR